jgi:hypothetical protein
VKAGAVSEVVGAIILISISVLAMGIVMLFFFSGPLPTSVPSFSGLVTNSSKIVYITHEGGDTLRVGRFRIYVDGVDETYNFTKSIRGNFSVGQVMNATLPKWPQRVVMVFNTSWGGETVLISANLLGKLPFTPPGWYDGAWANRKKITIPGSMVTGSLTDFPVLVYRVDTQLQNSAQAGGPDILFTSWDGTTKLPHEIEWFNKQSGSFTAWVKVPSLAAGSDTTIFVYYNNSAASNQQNPEGVWTNGYAGVWHLNESSGTRFDSTANNNDLTDWNTVARSVGVAMFAGGADFVRTNSEYLYINDAAQTGLDITGPITMEAWVQNDETVNPPYFIIDKARGTCGSGDAPYFLRLNSEGANLRECTVVTGSCGETPSDAQPVVGTITSGSWIHLVGTNDGAYTRVYKNSVQTDSEVYNSGIFNSDGAFYIGSQVNANYFDGLIDEARVSSVARSQDWLTTEYANMNNPAGFCTFGTQQTPLSMS